MGYLKELEAGLLNDSNDLNVDIDKRGGEAQAPASLFYTGDEQTEREALTAAQVKKPKATPAQVADTERLAKKNDIPFGVAHEKYGELAAREKVDNLIAGLSAAPVTREYMKNPQNATISEQDALAFAGFEKQVQSFGLADSEKPGEDTSLLGYFYEYAKQVIPDIAEGNVAGTERWDTSNREHRERYAFSLNGVGKAELHGLKMQAMQEGLDEDAAASRAMELHLAKHHDYWKGVADSETFAIDPKYRNPESFAEKVFAAAGGTAPGMTLTAANPFIGTMFFTQQIYGAEYKRLVDKGREPKAAADAAFMSALMQMPLEYAGNVIQLKAAARILKSSPTGKWLLNIAEGSAAEGLEEYLQQAPGLYADIRAEHPEWSHAQSFAAFLERLPRHMTSDDSFESALIGATLGAVLPGAAGAVRLPAALKQQKVIEEVAQKEQELFTALDETITGTETGQVAGERLAQLVHEIHEAAGGKVDTVYVDALPLQEATGSEFVRIAQALGVEDQVESATSSGGMLEVPIKQYAAAIANDNELAATLSNDRKFAPESLTMREQREHAKEYMDELKRVSEIAEEKRQIADTIDLEAKEVVGALTAQIRETGRMRGQERNNALLFGARLATIARRSDGQYSVKELFENFAPTISRMQNHEPQPADILKQTVSDGFAKWSQGAEVVDNAQGFEFQPDTPYTIKAYHGTTHEFDTIDPEIANIENHFGRGFYLSSDIGDVREHYEGVGMDLSNRIEQAAENIENLLEDGDYDEIEAAYGVSAEDAEHSHEEREDEASHEIASLALIGEHKEGKALELYVKMRRPLILTPDGGASIYREIDMDYYKEIAEDEIDRDDYVDEDGDFDEDSYNDDIYDRAMGAYYEDFDPAETGNASALFDAIKEVAFDYDVDGEQLIAEMQDAFGFTDGEEVNAQQIFDWMRENENLAYAEDPEGQGLASAEILRKVAEAMGYDGIIMDAGYANQKWNMGIGEGTWHFITWTPNSVKSATDNSGGYSLFDDNIYRQNVEGKKADELRGALILEGSFFRGGESQPVVGLFEKANPSTFTHEMGHYFLELTRHLATLPDAHESVVEEWAEIKEALGIEGDSITEEQHEAFADSLIEYVAKGKAPSKQLIPVFTKFFAWLKTVYRSVMQTGALPSKELQPIFDRMFATDEEIAEANEMYDAQKPFFEAADLEAEDERKRYEKRRRKADESAWEKRFRKYWGAYLQALGGKRQFKKDAADEVDAMPAYRAMAEAKTQGGLSIPDLDYMVGMGTRKVLTKAHGGLATIKGTAAPEVVAANNGFASVDEMVAALINADKRAAIIDTRTKQKLIAEEKRIRDELLETGELPPDVTYHANERLDVLVSEFNLLKGIIQGAEDFTPPSAVVADAFSRANAQAEKLFKARENRNEKDLRSFVNGVIQDNPLYSLVTELRKQPFSYETLLKDYDKATLDGILKKFPRVFSKSGGIDPDVSITELGYESVADLLDELADAASVKEYRASLLEELDASFNSEQGYEDAGAIVADLAQAFMNADPRTKIAQMQHAEKTLESADKLNRVEASAIREVARKVLGEKKVTDAASPRKYMSLEKKAARKARAAKNKGNLDEALLWKKREMLNHAMALEALKVRQDVAAIAARLKRSGKAAKVQGMGGTVDQKFAAQIINLLHHFGLSDSRAETHDVPLSTFVESLAKSEEGSPVVFAVPELADWILYPREDKAMPMRKTLTLNELGEFDRAIKWLLETGRDVHKGRLATYKETLKEMVEGLLGTLSALPKRYLPAEKYKKLRKFSNTTRKYIAQSTTFATFMDMADGYTNAGRKAVKGLHFSKLVEAMYRADSERIRMGKEAVKALSEITDVWKNRARKLGVNPFDAGIDVPEILRDDNQSLTYEKCICILLNAGTLKGRKRLEDGLGITERDLRVLASKLSAEELYAVQKAWDYVGSFWNALQREHQKMYHFEQVAESAAPLELTSAEGAVVNLKGGYYHLDYDARLSQQVSKYKEDDDIMRNRTFGAPGARAGMMKARVEGKVELPVNLSLGVLIEQVNDAINFISHGAVVRDVDRILRAPEYSKAFIDAFGVEAYNMLRPILENTVRSEPVRALVGDGAASSLRNMTAVYVLGLNVQVAMKQTLSAPGILRDIGVGTYLKGAWMSAMGSSVAKDAAHMQKTMHAVHELSPYMADRWSSATSEMSDLRGHWGVGTPMWKRARDWVADNVSMILIRVMDTVVVYPAWLGEFNAEMGRNGGDFEKAAIHADGVIKKTQPSFRPIDQTMVQFNKTSAARFFNMFMTATLKFANRQVYHVQGLGKKQISKKEFAAFMLVEMMAPPVAWYLVRALGWGLLTDEDDDKTLTDHIRAMAADTAMYQTSGWLYARDVSAFINGVAGTVSGDRGGFAPSLINSPLSTMFELAERMTYGLLAMAYDLEDEDKKDKAIMALAELFSAFARVPVFRAYRKLQEGWRQYTEEEAGEFNILIPDPEKRRK